MQKGFSVVILIIIVLVFTAVMFIPIPYYQKDTFCIMIYPTKCYGGWQLSQPLWKRIFLGITQQSISSQPTPSPSPAPFDINTSKYDSLTAKVKSEGVIRVIVSLNISGGDEQAIAEAQDKLLNELSFYNVSSATKFKYTPAVALEVNEGVLNFLVSSPDIKNIEEDQVISIPDCNKGPC
ncbi:hypothetical protein A3J13_02000 [Candidatus Daviesbacteria bacterium RIFCSPLOWO2_02_FULL_36_8]|uniref:Inhibitor I9 domain-containing protein n=1 Tax=Candidatus Daviesbacteria bacterium RIFCSPLOWO2_02_FULL_36_8 TaxID=1797793 RepID=A0A1F5MGI1_9BACT|nr:MAG: hypothetical protein A3J13_02000 [Candidatus Daviesbacteria bacterium RIFCSPLOWO2_02_FULL_36_8]